MPMQILQTNFVRGASGFQNLIVNLKLMEVYIKIMDAAQYLIDIYGDHVEHLGQHQGAEAIYYDVTQCPAFSYIEGIAYE